MEEDISNYSSTVMFRGTPCNSLIQGFITADRHAKYIMQGVQINVKIEKWLGRWDRQRNGTIIHDVTSAGDISSKTNTWLISNSEC